MPFSIPLYSHFPKKIESTRDTSEFDEEHLLSVVKVTMFKSRLACMITMHFTTLSPGHLIVHASIFKGPSRNRSHGRLESFPLHHFWPRYLIKGQ